MYGIPSINDTQQIYEEKLIEKFKERPKLKKDSKLTQFTTKNQEQENS
jgi:hypothetical protein